MRKIVIAGGSGYLGQSLIKYFITKGYHITVLSREHHLNSDQLEYVKWDGAHFGYWVNSLENSYALINLSGKSVDCRYTEKNKQLIYNSRIDSTYILGQAVKQLNHPPLVWINASSATIYRHSLDKEMDEENGEIGSGFSVDVCKKWEQVFNDIILNDTRKVILRTAIVLGKSGGAFKPLKALAKVGLGGKQGDGNQYFSWLHEMDFNRIVEFAIENKEISGVYNASSPFPLTNSVLMKKIRKAFKIPLGVPIPEFLLKLGAFIIRTEPELILKSRRVIPLKLLNRGFKFHYEHLDNALEDLSAIKT